MKFSTDSTLCSPRCDPQRSTLRDLEHDSKEDKILECTSLSVGSVEPQKQIIKILSESTPASLLQVTLSYIILLVIDLLYRDSSITNNPPTWYEAQSVQHTSANIHDEITLSLECFHVQRFREKVRVLVPRCEMRDLELSIIYVLSQKMMTDINVFQVIRPCRVLRQVDCPGIVLPWPSCDKDPYQEK